MDEILNCRTTGIWSKRECDNAKTVPEKKLPRIERVQQLERKAIATGWPQAEAGQTEAIGQLRRYRKHLQIGIRRRENPRAQIPQPKANVSRQVEGMVAGMQHVGTRPEPHQLPEGSPRVPRRLFGRKDPDAVGEATKHKKQHVRSEETREIHPEKRLGVSTEQNNATATSTETNADSEGEATG